MKTLKKYALRLLVAAVLFAAAPVTAGAQIIGGLLTLFTEFLDKSETAAQTTLLSQIMTGQTAQTAADLYQRITSREDEMAALRDKIDAYRKTLSKAGRYYQSSKNILDVVNYCADMQEELEYYSSFVGEYGTLAQATRAHDVVSRFVRNNKALGEQMQELISNLGDFRKDMTMMELVKSVDDITSKYKETVMTLSEEGMDDMLDIGREVVIDGGVQANVAFLRMPFVS